MNWYRHAHFIRLKNKLNYSVKFLKQPAKHNHMWLWASNSLGNAGQHEHILHPATFACLWWDKKKEKKKERSCAEDWLVNAWEVHVFRSYEKNHAHVCRCVAKLKFCIPFVQDYKYVHIVTFPKSTRTHFSRWLWCSSSVSDTARGSPLENSSWWSRVQSASKLWAESEPA